MHGCIFGEQWFFCTIVGEANVSVFRQLENEVNYSCDICLGFSGSRIQSIPLRSLRSVALSHSDDF